MSWKKDQLGRGNSKCKCPGVGKRLAWSSREKAVWLECVRNDMGEEVNLRSGQKGWVCGSSGRASALQAPSPEFKPHPKQTKI
jgi:hypothetical protein